MSDARLVLHPIALGIEWAPTVSVIVPLALKVSESMVAKFVV